MPSTFLFVMVRLPTSLCAWSALQLVPLDDPRQRHRNQAEPQRPAALRGETLSYINKAISVLPLKNVHLELWNTWWSRVGSTMFRKLCASCYDDKQLQDV